MPRASIIIPAYNAENFIGLTLNSIIQQTYKDFECLVIDDGSTDNTIAAVSGFNDPRIKVFRGLNSGGPAKPRNIGLNNASGEYIFMFDSDDIMLPNKLALSIDALEKNPSANLLFTNFQAINENGEIIKENFLHEYETLWGLVDKNITQPLEIHARDVFSPLLKVNFVGTSSVVLRKSSLKEANRFNESLKNSDDRLFWIEFSRCNNFLFLNAILHQYRVRSNSISSQGFDRRAPSKIAALKKILEFCEFDDDRKTIKQQIQNDYIGLAYCYRYKRQYKNSLHALMVGAKYGFEPRLFKCLIATLMSMISQGRGFQ